MVFFKVFVVLFLCICWQATCLASATGPPAMQLDKSCSSWKWPMWRSGECGDVGDQPDGIDWCGGVGNFQIGDVWRMWQCGRCAHCGWWSDWLMRRLTELRLRGADNCQLWAETVLWNPTTRVPVKHQSSAFSIRASQHFQIDPLGDKYMGMLCTSTNVFSLLTES